MTVLQVTSHLNIGGITNYVLSLSERLIRRGHRVAIASDHGDQEPRAAASGAALWTAPLHTKQEFSPQVFGAARELARRLRSEQVDLIHAHTRVGQVVAASLSRRARIPYVTTWHGFFRPNPGRWLWPCYGVRTIAISEPVRRHLLTQFRVPAERVRLVWNGIDTERFAQPPAADVVARFRSEQGIAPGAPVIGGVGRLASGRVKGFDLLLEAAVRVKEQFPNLRVIIAGEGPRRQFLEEKIDQFGLRSCARLIGAVDDVRIPLAAMDVFVFPARWPEGFGLTLVEAMAAARPVVATQVGAVPSIVEDRRSGLLVPVERPDALAAAIVRLLGDRPGAERLGQQARQRVREAFSLDSMVDGIEAIYREAVKSA